MRPVQPAVWFPAIRARSGSDVFTQRLVAGLRDRGLRAEVTWLPHRAEYAPWTVPAPVPPRWANIVHANSWTPLRFLPANLPLVVSLHHCVHDAALAPYKGIARDLYHRFWVLPMEKDLMGRASRRVAVSRYTAEQAGAVFRGLEFEIILNGLDTAIFRPATARRAHGPFRLLFVGNWSTRKGADLLAPIMHELGQGFELIYAQGLHRRSIASRLPENMRPVARPCGNTGMVRLYQESDALLFPTRLEGFGLAALEAQACGLPVIATRGSALPEVVVDGETGLLCPQDDVHAFAAAARKLAEDPALWQSMGRAGRVRAKRYFGIETMVDRYLDVYGSVLSAGYTTHLAGGRPS